MSRAESHQRFPKPKLMSGGVSPQATAFWRVPVRVYQLCRALGGVGRRQAIVGDQQDTARQRASQFIREAEQRRDEQARIVAGLAGPPEVLAFAERVLKEMESTLAMARLHESYLQFMDE